MLKYVDTQVTFAEVPNEITLCINISNCPIKCDGCHSPYLAEDIGATLDSGVLDLLIKGNEGITCVCFMGGDTDVMGINSLAHYVKKYYPSIKVGWYSGSKELSSIVDLWNLDFVKIGPYIKSLGPLNKRTTNQRLYRVVHLTSGKSKMYDITYKFWKEDD